jgi:predicted GTPase
MREGPFEELKSEEVERNFNKAINSECEIAVIATMSSGKSTLINSILSQELMPSKNTACTAKITRIKDNYNLNQFNAVCKNINEEVVSTIKTEYLSIPKGSQVPTAETPG